MGRVNPARSMDELRELLDLTSGLAADFYATLADRAVFPPATARELRARPWANELVLVALTGWGQEEDRRRSSDAGFDRHLVKPVDPAVLEQMLEDYVKKAAAHSRA